MRSALPAVALLLAAALCGSLGGVLIKSIDWPPLATLIPLLEPILKPLWVMLALSEHPGPWAIVGGALAPVAVLGRGAMMWRAGARERNDTAASFG